MCMRNAPHDASAMQIGPTDQNGRPLTYTELVMAMRTALQMPAGPVHEMTLEEV